VGFLIDTSIWIDVERGRLSVADVHNITKQEPIFLSPINLAELAMGVELMTDLEQKQQGVRMLRRLKRKPLLRITGETGEIFGKLCATMMKSQRGADFRIQDLWLAAQALQRHLIILTSNAKDFQDVPGLKVIEMKRNR
jgi:predicted nucleic acid-binding protein